MSAYASFLDRARETAGLVSELEAAFAKDPGDKALRVTLRSAARMAERAERELYDIAHSEQVDLVRYRLVRHAMNAFGLQSVSKSLELFQETVSYVYQAVTGQPRVRASMTKADKRDSELLFGYSYAGSLGVVLLAPSQRGLFITKFDEVVQTINQVFDIDNNFELKDAAKKIGPAAVRKLYEWSEANYQAGYDLDLRWTNANALEAGRYLETNQFGKLAELISLTSDITSKPIRTSGTLVGFDSVYKTFHLVEPNGESFKGHLAKDFPMHRDWTINRRYEALIQSDVATKFSTGEETAKYSLSSLRPLDEGPGGQPSRP